MVSNMETISPSESKQDSKSLLLKKKGETEDDFSFEDRRLKVDIERMVSRILTGEVNEEAENALAASYQLVISPETAPALLVGRPPVEVRLLALDFLIDAIRSVTATMTAIPRPVTFLRSHFTALQLFFEDPLKAPEDIIRRRLATVLSVVATTVPSENRLILHYYFQSLREPLSRWGLEYQRSLARELGAEYQARRFDYSQEKEKQDGEADSDAEPDSEADEQDDLAEEADLSDLMVLLDEILKLYFSSSNETEGVDLAVEMNSIPKLLEYITASSAYRVCRYLLACHPYAGSVEDRNLIVHTAYQGFLRFGYFVPALYAVLLDFAGDTERREKIKTAVMDICLAASNMKNWPVLGVPVSSDPDAVSTKTAKALATSNNTTDDMSDAVTSAGESATASATTTSTSTSTVDLQDPDAMKGLMAQIGYILGSRFFCFAELEDTFPEVFEAATNAQNSAVFRRIASDFGATAPRLPSAYLRTQADEATSFSVQSVAPRKSTGGPTVDNSLKNLASSIANGLINAGAGVEALFTPDPTGAVVDENSSTTPWVLRHKEEHRLAATASLGLVHLWDVEEGFSALDAFESSGDPAVQAGASLAFGVLSSGIASEMNASIALLSDKLDADNPASVRLSAALGLGISHVATCNEDVLEALVPMLLDIDTPIEVAAHAALGLALAYLGSSNADVSEAILQAMFDRLESTPDVAALHAQAQAQAQAQGDAAPEKPTASAAMAHSIALNSESALRLLVLALGLLHTGAADAANNTLSRLQDMTHNIVNYAIMTVTTFSFFGFGSVEKIQALVNACNEVVFDEEDDISEEQPVAKSKKSDKSDKTKGKKGTATAAAAAAVPAASTATTTATVEEVSEETDANATDASPSAGMTDDVTTTTTDATPATTTIKGAFRYLPQDAAALGIAAVSLSDDVTSQMASRLLEHLSVRGATNLRRTVPLALAMLHVSDPSLTVASQLFKLAHDQDEFVARRACIALGFIGAGSNNSKIAENLRYLATYFQSEPSHLFLVQIAQGMLHAGKGMVTLAAKSLHHTEIEPVSAGLLLLFMHLLLDPCDNLIKRRQHLWVLLAPMIRSKALVSVDADGQLLPVPIRVGQGVDVVGQPGNPRHITGFQTQNTPVLISHGQGSELGTDDYLLVGAETPLIGTIVLKKNLHAAVHQN